MVRYGCYSLLKAICNQHIWKSETPITLLLIGKDLPVVSGRFTLSKEMTHRWTFLYILKVRDPTKWMVVRKIQRIPYLANEQSLAFGLRMVNPKKSHARNFQKNKLNTWIYVSIQTYLYLDANQI